MAKRLAGIRTRTHNRMISRTPGPPIGSGVRTHSTPAWPRLQTVRRCRAGSLPNILDGSANEARFFTDAPPLWRVDCPDETESKEMLGWCQACGSGQFGASEE